MMNVRDRLIAALEPLGYEVSLQGSYADDEPLSASFITYTIYDTSDEGFYDNNPTRADYFIQIVFYSKDFNLVKSVPDDIYSSLKAAGFIRVNRGRDVDFNIEHYAWLCEYFYMERSS